MKPTLRRRNQRASPKTPLVMKSDPSMCRFIIAEEAPVFSALTEGSSFVHLDPDLTRNKCMNREISRLYTVALQEHSSPWTIYCASVRTKSGL